MVDTGFIVVWTVSTATQRSESLTVTGVPEQVISLSRMCAVEIIICLYAVDLAYWLLLFST